MRGQKRSGSQLLVLLKGDRRRVRFAAGLHGGATMPKQTFESTAGEVTAELLRRSVSPKERVTITLEPEQELILDARNRARVWSRQS